MKLSVRGDRWCKVVTVDGEPVGYVAAVLLLDGQRERWTYDGNVFQSALFVSPRHAARKMLERRSAASGVRERLELLNGGPLEAVDEF